MYSFSVMDPCQFYIGVSNHFTVRTKELIDLCSLQLYLFLILQVYNRSCESIGEGQLFLASQLMENRLIHNTSECNLSLSIHYIMLINSSIHVLMKPAYDLDWCSMILMLKIDFGTE